MEIATLKLEIPVEKRLLNRRITFIETGTVGSWTKITDRKQEHSVAAVLPRNEIFETEVLALSWKKMFPIGPGLINLGNTCFLNSVLQCLSYTPPLADFLLNRNHSRNCKQTSFCTFCALESHIIRCFTQRGSVCPKNIVGRLKHISKYFKVGRQEDSHEFLRCFVDSLQNSCLAGLGKLSSKQKEGSVIHQMFGGYTQSRIVCNTCKTHSDTIEPILDISLEIKNVSSIEKALSHYTKSELLSELVEAQKSISVLQPSNILILHLKRFGFHGSNSKITKMITFPEKINIQEFVWQAKSQIMYQLYGVLVHSGHSCNSGHYYSYVKAANGSWYLMDDSDVHQVSLNTVLKQNAYMLFYVATKDYQNKNGSAITISPRSDSLPGNSIGDLPKHSPTSNSSDHKKAASPLPVVANNSQKVEAKPKMISPFKSPKKDLNEPNFEAESPDNVSLPALLANKSENLNQTSFNSPISPVSVKPLPYNSSIINNASLVHSTDRWKVTTKLPETSFVKKPSLLGVQRELGVQKQNFSISSLNSVVGIWDTEGIEESLNKRDLMMKSSPKRHKKPDMYDLEYDSGRKKKLKNK